MAARKVDKTHNQAKLGEASKSNLIKRVNQVEKLFTERDEINAEIAEIKKDVKAEGYNMKAFNRLLADRRAREKDEEAFDEMNDMRDLYALSIGWAH